MLTYLYWWYALHALKRNGSYGFTTIVLVSSEGVGMGQRLQVAEDKILGQKMCVRCAWGFFMFLLLCCSQIVKVMRGWEE